MLVSLGSPSGSFHQWHGGQCTRIESQPVAHCELSRFELDGLCGSLHDALRFSRVGPVHLAHGVGWARLEASDSLRWPFLDAPVIHWPAVGCGRWSAPVGLIALARIPGAAGLSPGVSRQRKLSGGPIPDVASQQGSPGRSGAAAGSWSRAKAQRSAPPVIASLAARLKDRRACRSIRCDWSWPGCG